MSETTQPAKGSEAVKQPKTPANKPQQKTVFETLSEINLNDKLEKKEGMSYLSWPWAWGTVKKLYPDATYKVFNYKEDADLGFMCSTSITIQGETLTMWLPVMDSKHKSMKRHSYTYTTKFGEKTVEPVTMHDINRTIMRCLVKNLAMFGLGIYIYAGEDLPGEKLESSKVESPVASQSVGQPADKRTTLTLSSPNWQKVSDYVSANKNLGIDAIISQLNRKYIITENAHASIIKLCNQ